MGIETNLKYMLEEYKVETAKLERLKTFIKSEEFEKATDDTQKKIIKEKCELLSAYVGKLKEQIDYDKNVIDDKACYISKDGNYDDIEKSCMK